MTSIVPCVPSSAMKPVSPLHGTSHCGCVLYTAACTYYEEVTKPVSIRLCGLALQWLELSWENKGLRSFVPRKRLKLCVPGDEGLCTEVKS
jgi:hypothetical protein